MNLEIKYDHSPINPREEFENLGTIAYKHSRYNLGEEKISDPIDWLSDKAGKEEDEVSIIADIRGVPYYSDEVRKELEGILRQTHVLLPVYLFDHSGRTISTSPFSCKWDSGQIGYVYCSHDDIKEEYGNLSKDTLGKVESLLKGEIALFDQFIRGEVFGFEFTDDEGNQDSCWGFFGDDWENNGIKDHLPENAYHLLEGIEIT